MSEEVYLIWSHEHSAWWAPGMQGYVCRISNAGRYSREDAIKICSNALFGSKRSPNEVPVRLADVTAMVDGFIARIGREPDPEQERWA
jgi:hypothetical protein